MNRDEIIKMAREAKCTHVDMDGDRSCATDRLQRFAALVAAAEREACAKVSDELSKRYSWSADLKAMALICATAIRARGAQ